MPKHTPGPWRESQHWIIDKHNGGEYLEIRGANGAWVADVRQSRADARLIAKSPEMREALQRLLALQCPQVKATEFWQNIADILRYIEEGEA